MRRVRVIAALAALPLLAAVTYATTAAVRAAPQPVAVTYCPGVQMDLYLLSARPAHPVPAVLYVHGGAWRAGWRRDGGDLFPQLLPRLRSAGVFVAAADYRLAPAHPWPAQRDDVACAVGYLQSHAASLGIDPQRIRLYGTSAGGHIASMLAMQGLPGLDRVADLYGPADLTAGGWNPGMRSALRQTFGSSPAALAAASPTLLVTGGAPAFLVVQGACDTTVPVAQSDRFVARLRAAGDSVSYLRVRFAGHGLGACGGGSPEPSVSTVLDRTAAFLAG